MHFTSGLQCVFCTEQHAVVLIEKCNVHGTISQIHDRSTMYVHILYVQAINFGTFIMYIVMFFLGIVITQYDVI